MTRPGLWPTPPPADTHCFFVRIPTGSSREKTFEATARSLRSQRFACWGKWVLRLPTEGPWLVADCLGALGACPRRAMQKVSASVGTEVIGLDHLWAHGTPSDSLVVHRYVGGVESIGHSVHVEPDKVTPVVGDKGRLPLAIPNDELPIFWKTLKLPGTPSQPLSATAESVIRCLPVSVLPLALAAALLAALAWGLAIALQR